MIKLSKVFAFSFSNYFNSIYRALFDIKYLSSCHFVFIHDRCRMSSL